MNVGGKGKYRYEYQNPSAEFLDFYENVSRGLKIAVKGNERVASTYRDPRCRRWLAADEFVLPGVHCVPHPLQFTVPRL